VEACACSGRLNPLIGLPVFVMMINSLGMNSVFSMVGVGVAAEARDGMGRLAQSRAMTLKQFRMEFFYFALFLGKQNEGSR
jgi:hypothetical protein